MTARGDFREELALAAGWSPEAARMLAQREAFYDAVEKRGAVPMKRWAMLREMRRLGL